MTTNKGAKTTTDDLVLPPPGFYPMGELRDFEQKLLARLHAYFDSIEPNWDEFEVLFVGSDNKPLDPNQKYDDATYDAATLQVWLNGPKDGDVNVTEGTLAAVKESILRGWSFHDWWDRKNLKHRIELIHGRTYINFANCDSGYVINVSEDGQRFEVCIDRDAPVAYTRDDLVGEIEANLNGDTDDMNCDALAVKYFPFRRHGMVIVDALAWAAELERSRQEFLAKMTSQ